MRLGAEEARVIGCLLEKELTTPQQYPLTRNALVAACNQTSARHPVVTYDETTVETALDSLKDRRLVRFVHPSHGRSSTRFRHVLDEALGLDERQRALLAVLLLRGPQTAGELRSRTERLAPFTDVGEVERELETLDAHGEHLVARLARLAGQKEERYTQLLADPDTAPHAPPAQTPPAAPPSVVERPVVTGHAPVVDLPAVVEHATAVERLAGEMGRLRADLAELREALEDLRTSLGT